MATLSIDKSTWELVRLGDVAHEVRESLTKSDVQVDRSVGLEHIEPGDLHIRTWDELDESSSFTKVFREGHVLFGRRRAYLKKAALADFNGVCSGDITVISANEDLLPSLLPFVVSSDRFFAFAVEHSAGGLSPRVKWKDLANYEFLLPPKDQQTEIAELLWALDEVKSLTSEFSNRNRILREAFQKELFEFELVSASEIFSAQPGFAFKSGDFRAVGVPVVKIKDVDEERGQVLITESMDSVALSSDHDKFILRNDDVVVALTGALSGSGYVGKCGIVKSGGQDSYLNQRLIKVQSSFDSVLTHAILTSASFLRQVWVRSSQGAQANISAKDFLKCKIPSLPDAELDSLSARAKVFAEIDEVNESYSHYLKQIQASVLQEVFE